MPAITQFCFDFMVVVFQFHVCSYLTQFMCFLMILLSFYSGDTFPSHIIPTNTHFQSFEFLVLEVLCISVYFSLIYVNKRSLELLFVTVMAFFDSVLVYYWKIKN